MNAFERHYCEVGEYVQKYLGAICPRATEIFVAEIAKAIEAKNYKIANPWVAVFTQNKELASWWGEFYKQATGARRANVLNDNYCQCIFWDAEAPGFVAPADMV